jgi:hypothetical protein
MSAEEIKTEDPSEMDAIRAEIAELRKANRTLQDELMQRRPSDGMPTTAEGWHYALQAAQLRAAQNEELAAHYPTLVARYNAWAAKEQETVHNRQKDMGRLESEMARLGVEEDSPEFRTASRLVQTGLSYDDVSNAYIELIKKEKLKEARASAKDKQGKAAKKGAIEGGESRGSPPAEGTDKTTPDDQFMAALIEGARRRAPASVRLRRESTE